MGETDGSPDQKRVKQQQHQQSQTHMAPQYDPQLMQQSTVGTGYGANYQPTMSSGPIQNEQHYADPTPHQWQDPSVYPDPESGYAAQTNNGPYHNMNPYNLASLQQFANDVLDFNGGSAAQNHIHPDLRGPQQSQLAASEATNSDHMSNGAFFGPHHESVDSGVSIPDMTQLKSVETADTIRVARLNVTNGVEGSGEILPNGPAQAVDPEQAPLDAASTKDEQRQITAVGDPVICDSTEHVQDSAATSELSAAEIDAQPEEKGLSLHAVDDDTTPPMHSGAVIQATTETSPRHSSRHTKPIDRFSTSSNEGANGTRTKLGSNTPATALESMSTPTPSKKRKSTTPAAGTEKDKGFKKLKAAKSSVMSVDGQREESVLEQEEDESLRLARELQSESFGLRRRKSVLG